MLFCVLRGSPGASVWDSAQEDSIQLVYFMQAGPGLRERFLMAASDMVTSCLMGVGKHLEKLAPH